MEICGIQCIKDSPTINEVIDNRVKNPSIDIMNKFSNLDNNRTYEITIKTHIDNICYSSKFFYCINRTNIPDSIKRKFFTEFLEQLVKDHIKHIKEKRGIQIPEYKYNQEINESIKLNTI